MKAARTNSIERLSLEVRTASLKQANTFKDQLDSFVRYELLKFLEDYLGQFEGLVHSQINLEQLNIECDIGSKDWRFDLLHKWELALRKQLEPVIQSQIKSASQTPPDGQENQQPLLYFLKHGRLPWWLDLAPGEAAMDAWLYEQLASDQIKRQLIKGLSSDLQRQRLIKQFKDGYLLSLLDNTFLKTDFWTAAKKKQWAKAVADTSNKQRFLLWELILLMHAPMPGLPIASLLNTNTAHKQIFYGFTKAASAELSTFISDLARHSKAKWAIKAVKKLSSWPETISPKNSQESLEVEPLNPAVLDNTEVVSKPEENNPDRDYDHLANTTDRQTLHGKHEQHQKLLQDQQDQQDQKDQQDQQDQQQSKESSSSKSKTDVNDAIESLTELPADKVSQAETLTDQPNDSNENTFDLEAWSRETDPILNDEQIKSDPSQRSDNSGVESDQDQTVQKNRAKESEDSKTFDLTDTNSLEMATDTVMESKEATAKGIPPWEEQIEPKLKPKEHNNLDKGFEVKTSEEKSMYLQHCGFLLVHPFLKPFLKNCGLINDNGGLADKIKTAELLHYTATGKVAAYEHELLFFKFLCDIPQGYAMERSFDLSEDLKTKADELLTAVLGHLPQLGSSSIDLLRGEFLSREGKIVIGKETHKIIVARKTQDILLNNVPWNLSLIKLPWLKKIIYMDW